MTAPTRDEIVELVTKAARSPDSRMLGCGLDDLGRLIELVRADERAALALEAKRNSNSTFALQLRARGNT